MESTYRNFEEDNMFMSNLIYVFLGSAFIFAIIAGTLTGVSVVHLNTEEEYNPALCKVENYTIFNTVEEICYEKGDDDCGKFGNKISWNGILIVHVLNYEIKGSTQIVIETSVNIPGGSTVSYEEAYQIYLSVYGLLSGRYPLNTFIGCFYNPQYPFNIKLNSDYSFYNGIFITGMVFWGLTGAAILVGIILYVLK